MTAKILGLLIFLCAYQGAFGKTLEEIKANAAKKLRDDFLRLENESGKLLVASGLKIEEMTNLGNHRLTYGEFILNSTTSEINHILRAAKYKGAMMYAPKELYDCIEAKKRTGTHEVKEAYALKFVASANATVARVASVCLNQSLEWFAEAKQILLNYEKYVAQARNAIEVALSEEEVNFQLSAVERLGQPVSQFFKKILPEIMSTQIYYERLLESLLKEWKMEMKHILGKTSHDIDQCFLLSILPPPLSFHDIQSLY